MIAPADDAIGADDASGALARAHRDECARVVASLARRTGDLDVAEDAAAEAFAVAAERWPRDGVPANPGGWLTTTATRKAVDRLRRESRREAKHEAAHMLHEETHHAPTGLVTDDRLRLVFTCCHPALSPEARVALTLRLLGGLTVAEIARAFLVPETTMARRITRAKAKIRAAHIPFRVPTDSDVGDRLAAVLAVVYLVFNEGYLAGEGEALDRPHLADEAVRLGRLLRELLPDDGEVAGLLGLMLLTQARRPARTSVTGQLVTLGEQDRGRWDRTLLAEGHALVDERVRVVVAGGPRPGRYQLQAAVAAVHTSAARAQDTDWRAVLALYDALARLDPSPVVLLNRAVAVSEAEGAAAGLAEVERLLAAHPVLDGYHALHVTRAELLRRVGRPEDARGAYDRALSLTGNAAERAHLERRRDDTGRDTTG